MTRNFNPQKRDGARPPFRDTSSFNTSNGQEGYSQRPGRPRLNRASIDRAWQNGAQRNHPDYRPRTSGNNAFNAPSNGQYSRPNHYNGAQTNSNRSNYQAGSHPHAHQAPYQERRRSGGDGNTPNYKPNFARRRPEQQDWEPRQEPHSSHSGPHSHRSAPRRPFSNRFERGPAPQQRYSGQFEGDYESYNYQDRPRRQDHYAPRDGYQPRSRRRDEYTPEDSYQKPERHVTRLPDGRTLKGPRPVQRRNAQFWTEVAEDTGDLLSSVTHQEPTETVPGKKNKPTTTTSKQKPAQSRKPRASKGEKTAPPRAKGPRPSQRGYKWPTKG